MCQWLGDFFLAVDVNHRQRGSNSGGSGRRYLGGRHGLLFLTGGGDNAWTNCATLLCPHLDGGKKNGDNKKNKTGTILHIFSGRVTGLTTARRGAERWLRFAHAPGGCQSLS